jgi:hypothetical protein
MSCLLALSGTWCSRKASVRVSRIPVGTGSKPFSPGFFDPWSTLRHSRWQPTSEEQR